MPIIASAGSGAPRQLPPAGTHLARAYQIIDLGTHDKEWQGKRRKRREIRIVWELPNECADFGKGKLEPFAVHRNYTLSLDEKSNLRHDLEAWRGRAFTEEEVKGFDVGKVNGVPCMVTIVHATKDGSTYANVSGVTAIPKELKAHVPEPYNPMIEFSLADHDEAVFRALPDFLKEIIMASDEWKQAGAVPTDDDKGTLHHSEEPDGIPGLDDDGNYTSDCPF